MEQTNDGYLFGRNHCWLAAINACIGLDALASTGNGLELLSYRLGIPKLRALLGKQASNPRDMSKPQ
jgi:hypothetical protein